MLDMSLYLCPSSPISAYMLNSGENCLSYLDSKGYGRFLKNSHYETIWASEQYIWRGLDTSNLPNEIYSQFTGERYGAIWSKRWVNVGDVTERNPDIHTYDANGNLLRSASGGVSYLHVVKHHPTLTFGETRQTIADVVELTWTFDAQGQNLIERYWYANGLGLVGFSYYGSPPLHTRFSGLTNVKPTFSPLPNFAEPVPPPVETPPVPVTPFGAPIPMRVNAENGLRLRRSIPKGDEIRLMAFDEQVTGYPETKQRAGDYTWVVVTDALSNTGWAADLYLSPIAPIETWTVNLALPYVSQTTSDAAKSPNDCGIASLLMLIRYWYTRHGLMTPSLPSVDGLTPYTALADRPPPNGLTFAQIMALAQRLGFKTRYRQPLALDDLNALLHGDTPVMILVDYSVFNPAANAKIAHLCVVKAYNSAAFLVHDSYLGGADFRISREQLDAAMKSSPGNALGWQGLTLAV